MCAQAALLPRCLEAPAPALRPPEHSPPAGPPRAVSKLLVRFLRKCLGLAAVVWVLLNLELSPVPLVLAQSELLGAQWGGGGRRQRCAAAGAGAACLPTPHPLFHPPTAYSMYVILSVACDFLGAAVTTLLRLPVRV